MGSKEKKKKLLTEEEKRRKGLIRTPKSKLEKHFNYFYLFSHIKEKRSRVSKEKTK